MLASAHLPVFAYYGKCVNALQSRNFRRESRTRCSVVNVSILHSFEVVHGGSRVWHGAILVLAAFYLPDRGTLYAGRMT